eukprot:TRINITY_DN44091_c0_g1_i1.p1 TRINITY_DN44091_c0_g1~~TRINITY_DN44091_c0_g1_i1.p1  ORF type:complete len:192 (-),score=55.75 TRINITY_DN44091_c0_g1_i1:262-774(-)
MAPGPAEIAQEANPLEDGLVLWVPKTLMEKVSAAIEKKQDVSKEDVEKLMDSEDIADDVVMVPVDMTATAEIDDLAEQLETLGPNKLAEIFVKARKSFLDDLQTKPEAERENIQQEMSGAEYKEMMQAELDALEGMEGMECGESELEDEDLVDSEVEDADEPAAKKAKTE